MELITLQEDNKELFGLICTRREMELLNAFNMALSVYINRFSSPTTSEKSKFADEIVSLFNVMESIPRLTRPSLKFGDKYISAANIEVWPST